MTEAEALDMAAKAAGWEDWETLQLIGRPDTRDHIRAHAATIMENAALKAEIERLREAARPFAFAAKHASTIERRPHDFVLTSEFHALAAALKEIEGD